MIYSSHYCARCGAFANWRFNEALGKYTWCAGGHLVTESDRRRSDAEAPPRRPVTKQS